MTKTAERDEEDPAELDQHVLEERHGERGARSTASCVSSTIATAAMALITICASSLPRLDRPRDERRRQLVVVVDEADRAEAQR